jgi:hypothetical protein
MASVQLANFEYINQLKFRSTLRYTTTHKPDEVMEPNYFVPAMNWLDLFDLVDVVCRISDTEIATGMLEVVHAAPGDLRVRLLGEWSTTKAGAEDTPRRRQRMTLDKTSEAA